MSCCSPRRHSCLTDVSFSFYSNWAPRTEEDVELHAFLRKKFVHKHRVSEERVISGPGLASIYEWLALKFPEKIDPKVNALFEAAGSLKGGVVGKHSNTDFICGKAAEIMFSAFASECGNAMLKWLPTGGCEFCLRRFLSLLSR